VENAKLKNAGPELGWKIRDRPSIS